WRAIMLGNRGFRRDEVVQEDTYEIVAQYLELAGDVYGKRFKEYLLLQDCLTHHAGKPFTAPVWIPRSYFARDIRPNIVTALDGKDPEGVLLISSSAIATTRERLKLPMPMMSMPRELGPQRQQLTAPLVPRPSGGGS